MPTALYSVLRLSLLIGLLLALPAYAQSDPQPMSAEQRLQEERAAWDAAKAVVTRGPASIPLLDEAHLDLPADFAFIPDDAAARLLRSWGNRVAKNTVGLVVGGHQGDRWSVVIRFVKDGYIKDDDAKDWDADALLRGLRDGTDAANQDRRARGFPELEVVGWIAPPSYDAVTHRLISSIAVRRKDAAASDVEGVNFFTYALGRDGYFSFELLTNRQDVAHDRAASAPVADGLDYTPGHRYADFNVATDHVAAYGLAALVGVVAAKKLGLLALAGVFAAKFAKLGAIAVAVVGGLTARLFRRRRGPGGAA